MHGLGAWKLSIKIGSFQFFRFLGSYSGEFRSVYNQLISKGEYSGKVLAQVPKGADNRILKIKTEGNWQVETLKADEKSGDN